MRSICCWFRVLRYQGGDEFSVSRPWNTYTRPSPTPLYILVVGSIWIFCTAPSASMDAARNRARAERSTRAEAIFSCKLDTSAPPSRACAGVQTRCYGYGVFVATRLRQIRPLLTLSISRQVRCVFSLARNSPNPPKNVSYSP